MLVTGASGGIGAYAVQLAALAGARVTGMTTTQNLDRVRSWGASSVVDRQHTAARDLASGDRFDVVLDAHGGSDYAELQGLLRDEGTVVSTRPISRDSWRTIAGLVTGVRHRASFGAVMSKPSSADLARLLELLRRGSLVAPIDSVVPVAQVRAAHERAETAAAGKVVLAF